MNAHTRDSAGIKVASPLIHVAGLILVFWQASGCRIFSAPVVVSRTLGGLLIGLGLVLAFVRHR